MDRRRIRICHLKRFKDLTERELLALAIALEEEDERVYADFAEGFREHYPASAELFGRMRDEESEHRRALTALYRERFGDHIPLVRRQDVRGFVARSPIWLTSPLRIEAARAQVEAMEAMPRPRTSSTPPCGPTPSGSPRSRRATGCSCCRSSSPASSD